jgi:ribonuclease VapC
LAVVLDASAVLALLNDEEGASTVEQLLHESAPSETGHSALLSTVNLIEVRQYAPPDALAALEDQESPIGTVALTVEQAALAADLWSSTRHLGLSLADRVCIALGIATRLTVVTAEHRWLNLDLDITITHIRPWTIS